MSYRVAVRALCEFTAKQGDLDLRFTPSPTALEGIAGHTTVTARRADGYEREVTLEGSYRSLSVRGRADGYDPVKNQLEEIKTYRGDLVHQPANHRYLHWAQAKVYGWLLCETRGLQSLNVALVYFDVVSQKETVLVEPFTADDLKVFFETQCQRFIAWAEQELAHRAERDQALRSMTFPYGEFRSGQRQLAEAVYKSACTGTHLMAQAPTGIGKTLATLFPQLKAFPGQQMDKLFFLTAKTSGRQLALDALKKLSQGSMPLRTLELIARDKACEHPDKACHGESCPLARGFYDRIPAARAQAITQPFLDQANLRDVALAHQVCPYYLSQELARWADVVVGDYNYYFDMSALLYSLTLLSQWRVGVLVDEAHNLLERGRGMYTAELDARNIKALRKTSPAVLKKPIERVLRYWNDLQRLQTSDYQVIPELPHKLINALQQAVSAITDYLGEHATGLDPTLQAVYFDAMHFCRLTELFGEHSLFDCTLLPAREGGYGGRASVLCVRNVLPGPFLAPRMLEARSCVLFSATLAPQRFYADTLGVPHKHVWIDVESPFRAEQLEVHLARHISTRYRDRYASRQALVDLLAEQYRERPGNYLAFFSSFDYLQQVTALLHAQHPDLPCWEQTRSMHETARNAFLERFTDTSSGIGFAVLGGAFSEGIDLPGDRLIGAFVATLGLPQINPINEQMKARMDRLFGAGYDYTYLFPGLQKVVQAAGRVIRTTEDAGVVHLIDDRFGQPQVRRLLPAWWNLSV